MPFARMQKKKRDPVPSDMLSAQQQNSFFSISARGIFPGSLGLFLGVVIPLAPKCSWNIKSLAIPGFTEGAHIVTHISRFQRKLPSSLSITCPHFTSTCPHNRDERQDAWDLERFPYASKSYVATSEGIKFIS